MTDDQIDRCELCGEDRGDGYCQNCPDDPDRVSDQQWLRDMMAEHGPGPEGA